MNRYIPTWWVVKVTSLPSGMSQLATSLPGGTVNNRFRDEELELFQRCYEEGYTIYTGSDMFNGLSCTTLNPYLQICIHSPHLPRRVTRCQ